MRTAYITAEDCLKHEMEPSHPESPQRLRAIREALEHSGLWQELEHHDAKPVEAAALVRAHPKHYVDTIRNRSPEDGLAFLDPDTAINAHSLSAASRAAGAVVQGVDLVCDSDATRHAFCAVRPPGHHAETERAMGFCVYNNIAVGALHALAREGIDRVAVLDFDVHHGNGTVDICQDEERILVCSSFQYPFYPFRYQKADSDHIINTRLYAGSGSREFREAVEAQWLPALDAFKPQLLLVSAGFDAHRDDPLGQLTLDETDYRWVAQLIADVARRHAGGRIVAALEGGYNLTALGQSVDSHLQALIESGGG